MTDNTGYVPFQLVRCFDPPAEKKLLGLVLVSSGSLPLTFPTLHYQPEFYSITSKGGKDVRSLILTYI